jgi:anionic cell wall polymer biosynthesis LytR-Cps2A-Psr (LCP) family protein
MSKGLKIGLTYIITLIAAFAIFGFIGWLFIDMMRNDSGSTIPTEPAAAQEFIPTSSDNRTLIAALDLGDRKSDVLFIVIRFLPEDTNAVFITLPPDTLCGSQTLYDLYRSGSGTGVRDGAKTALGIDIDKYIVMDKTSFKSFCDIFSGSSYNIPYNMIYTDDDGSQIVITQGEKYLDTATVEQLITCPGYKNGEEERATTSTSILTSMMSKKLTSSFTEFMDNTFNTVINSGVTTDISAFDFEDSRDALRYTVSRTDRFFRPAFPTGTYNENGEFVLDPEFITALNTIFKIDKEQ